jgi:hypothetical protein
MIKRKGPEIFFKKARVLKFIYNHFNFFSFIKFENPCSSGDLKIKIPCSNDYFSSYHTVSPPSAGGAFLLDVGLVNLPHRLISLRTMSKEGSVCCT